MVAPITGMPRPRASLTTTGAGSFHCDGTTRQSTSSKQRLLLRRGSTQPAATTRGSRLPRTSASSGPRPATTRRASPTSGRARTRSRSVPTPLSTPSRPEVAERERPAIAARRGAAAGHDLDRVVEHARPGLRATPSSSCSSAMARDDREHHAGRRCPTDGLVPDPTRCRRTSGTGRRTPHRRDAPSSCAGTAASSRGACGRAATPRRPGRVSATLERPCTACRVHDVGLQLVEDRVERAAGPRVVEVDRVEREPLRTRLRRRAPGSGTATARPGATTSGPSTPRVSAATSWPVGAQAVREGRRRTARRRRPPPEARGWRPSGCASERLRLAATCRIQAADSSPLRVGVLADTIDRPGGIGRYTEELVAGLARRDDVRLIVGAPATAADRVRELAGTRLDAMVTVPAGGPARHRVVGAVRERPEIRRGRGRDRARDEAPRPPHLPADGARRSTTS